MKQNATVSKINRMSSSNAIDVPGRYLLRYSDCGLGFNSAITLAMRSFASVMHLVIT